MITDAFIEAGTVRMWCYACVFVGRGCVCSQSL